MKLVSVDDVIRKLDELYDYNGRLQVIDKDHLYYYDTQYISLKRVQQMVEDRRLLCSGCDGSRSIGNWRKLECGGYECTECGAVLDKSTRFCPECGNDKGWDKE